MEAVGEGHDSLVMAWRDQWVESLKECSKVEPQSIVYT